MAEAEHKQEEKHVQPTMTEGKKGMRYRYAPDDARRSVCTFIVVFLLLAGITVLILWLVYRPNKPHFTVVGAGIYEFNITPPTMISTTMQFTVITRNPNKRTSIYYDRLSAHVSYRNQQITPVVMLPPLFHETKTTVALSPIIGGSFVPVSMEVANGLMMDQAYGVVGLKLVLIGRVRYKAGSIKTAHYGIFVKCNVLIGVKKGVVGQVPLLGSPDCNVDS